MPVYDYKCTDCNKLYDVFHKGVEVVDDIVCPSCGSLHHKKLMSIPVVSMNPTSTNSGFSSGSSCESGGCCGGSCGLS